MKTGIQVIEEFARKAGFEVPQDSIPDTLFAALRLPMIVACSSCEMTMALPSATVDREYRCFCHECSLFEDE